MLTTDVEMAARFRPLGRLHNITAGLRGEVRDYNTAGFSQTPDTEETSAAAYLYGETRAGRWSANASLRLDRRVLDPDEAFLSSTVGQVRRRAFTGVSGGLAVRRHMVEGLTVGISALRSFRAPGVEEAFSEGPHLAAYAYEVGNADLGSEHGLGLEATATWERHGQRLHGAVFLNDIDGFIFPRNTGQISLRRGDLLLYQFDGQDVVMWGAEAGWDLPWAGRWRSEGAISFVRGELSDGEVLPQMPPLQGRTGLRWDLRDAVAFGVSLRAASDQNRPGRFEAPTDGYAVLDLTAEMHHVWLGALHTLTLGLDNVTDARYRRHLNRVREIMPEPGRNLRVLHRVLF